MDWMFSVPKDVCQSSQAYENQRTHDKQLDHDKQAETEPESDCQKSQLDLYVK